MASNMISAEGRKKLQERYDFLWETERPRMVKNMADAAAEGDRSENAEYIYSKKRLREIDRELKHLGDRLKVVKVVYPPLNPAAVSFGCWVTYQDEEGEERCYQLVGPDEFDVAAGKISVDSPVGKALLGRRVDDEITIRRPAGDLTVTIVAITSTRPA
ncbi:Transcription elongation factor GreB [Citrifermentans bremense]|uniref:Transcription elongation factor GreB n=2 Tax=Geobacteraceae TaxID=213422 RepID=A0ABQ0MKF5_9BACT|nr:MULTISPECIES: GreA/GreB family elongation factor [Geobacteraceae]BCG45974.1 Transcription elongation factor GreB [Citrifermentans bremense]GAW67577.1 transcription elongation factor GreB [Geoanaerobacter pelophilus]